MFITMFTTACNCFHSCTRITQFIWGTSWGKGGRCVELTTYHPCSAESQEIRNLNLPGTPWATSACRGTPLLYLSEVHSNIASPIIRIWRRWGRCSSVNMVARPCAFCGTKFLYRVYKSAPLFSYNPEPVNPLSHLTSNFHITIFI